MTTCWHGTDLEEADCMNCENEADAFEEWLRKNCFQKPTNEAYDLAKSAWNAALSLAHENY